MYLNKLFLHGEIVRYIIDLNLKVLRPIYSKLYTLSKSEHETRYTEKRRTKELVN